MWSNVRRYGLRGGGNRSSPAHGAFVMTMWTVLFVAVGVPLAVILVQTVVSLFR